MTIRNPIGLIFKGFWLVWTYTFGFVLGPLVISLMKSDRCWEWFITKVRAAQWDEKGIQKMEAARGALVSGGATVTMPTVERLPSDEAGISGEAKP